MYTFIPTLGGQVPSHCEGTLKEILDWNERPSNPHHSLEGGNWIRLDTTSTPGFGTKKRRKQRPVSFDSVYVERAWGCETLTIKELINKLQTTLGNGRVKERK